MVLRTTRSPSPQPSLRGRTMTAATGWEATLPSRATGETQHGRMAMVAGVVAAAGAVAAGAVATAEVVVGTEGPRATLRCMADV